MPFDCSAALFFYCHDMNRADARCVMEVGEFSRFEEEENVRWCGKTLSAEQEASGLLRLKFPGIYAAGHVHFT